MSDGAANFRRPPEAYERYMGRWSRLLAVPFADAAEVAEGQRVLDVGCGTGALTTELVRRLGAQSVSAIDPSPSFADACAAECPGADVRLGSAESLPFDDEAYDRTLSQLAINFVPDPTSGAKEMRRVTRRGGVVAACTWDLRRGMEMLRTFWEAAAELDPSAPNEGATMPLVTASGLEELWRTTGLEDVTTAQLSVHRDYSGFDDFWEPFTFGVGPAGAYTTALSSDRREALRDACFRRLGEPEAGFSLTAVAWFVRGIR